MSHVPIDVIDHLLLTVYPVIGIFMAEIVSRKAGVVKWIKFIAQAAICVGFGIAYLVALPVPHWLTAIVLFALAVALLYQAKIAKVKPDKSIY